MLIRKLVSHLYQVGMTTISQKLFKVVIFIKCRVNKSIDNVEYFSIKVAMDIWLNLSYCISIMLIASNDIIVILKITY